MKAAVQDLADALDEGWKGLPIGETYDLDDIAQAHLHIENRKATRALVKVK